MNTKKLKYKFRMFLTTMVILFPILFGIAFMLTFHVLRMQRTAEWFREGMDTALSWRSFHMAIYADKLVKGYALIGE